MRVLGDTRDFGYGTQWPQGQGGLETENPCKRRVGETWDGVQRGGQEAGEWITKTQIDPEAKAWRSLLSQRREELVVWECKVVWSERWMLRGERSRKNLSEAGLWL